VQDRHRFEGIWGAHCHAYCQAQILQLFRVSDDPDLTRAQFDAFSKQIPLLYFILISNTLAVAYTYVNVAPDWLTMIIPGVLTMLAALRTFWWLRQRHLVRSDADILRNLRATNWMNCRSAPGSRPGRSRSTLTAIPSPRARSRSTWP
jgi:predicted signal transduction protein with EAL and GGDEF domain